MDVAQYYVTTLTNAFEKIGPVLLLVGAGYFFFIKLPFFLMYRIKKEMKKAEEKDDFRPLDYGDLNAKKNRPQIDENEFKEKQEKREKEREQERLRQQRKREERERERKEEEARAKFKEYERNKKNSPEEVFDFKAGETITKKELKKRYHQLLRQNHPDKVAQLGNDFKKLAEQKTKDINRAYEELMKKAS